MPDEPGPPPVAGLRLDGHEDVVISATENESLCRTMGVAPDPVGAAHPIYYYIAAQAGMGLSVAELCAACDFDISDGPIMAGSEAEFHAPLMTETPYRVTGEIVALTRKKSRKFGTIDLLDYRLRLEQRDRTAMVSARSLWVLPR